MKSSPKDIHTGNSVPFFIKIVRVLIKVIYLFSKKSASKIVLSLFCKPIKGKQNKARQDFYKSGKTDQLSIRGFEINVLVKGNSGPTVFLNHGWNADAYSMRYVINHLVDNGYTVIAPDMAAHGRSSGSNINQIEMSFILEKLLLHYSRFFNIEYIVTHSWGGTVTLLTLDVLFKKGIELPIKKMVSLSMPSHPGAITKMFCNLLDLNSELSADLLANLDGFAAKDNRTLKEAFPYFLDNFMQNKKFTLDLIHDMDDQVIPVKNSMDMVKKYKGITITTTSNLGHIKIKNSAKVKDIILSSLKEDLLSKKQVKPLEFISDF